MRSYLYSQSFEGTPDGEAAKISRVEELIKNRELDSDIRKMLPTELFGQKNELLRIGSSNQLIDTYHQLDATKLDVTNKLKDINYIGLNDQNKIILSLLDNDESLTAPAIYDFTRDFFEELFNMGKFANFCIANNHHDLVKDNVDTLLKRKGNDEKQFRLLRKKHTTDEWLIRGITSTKYNNYDNHIAIYLSLLALHKFAIDFGRAFYVKKAFLSDSSMNLIFEQERAINVPGVGDIYFGAIVSNNEIREKRFSFELRYRLVDVENPEKCFSGIPKLDESVFSINHAVGINTVQTKLRDMFKLAEKEKLMLEFVQKLDQTPILSDNALYSLFKYITTTQNQILSKETKDTFTTLYDKYLVNNALTLIDVFDKVNTITSDIDEKITLERIYHKVLMDITQRL